MAGNSYEKPDFWSKKAFSEGYPARSVYKLQEIDEKFHILKKNARILDLGAAPGSWTVYVLRYLGASGQVTSIDLNPLAKEVKGDNLTFIQGDLYDERVRNHAAALGPYDALICDAAPPTTGNKLVDTARSADLVELALFYAQTMVKKGGNCAVKIFQGGDQSILLRQMREIFQSAKGFKPKACRSESFETYLIGLDKKN
ncbi:MAG TPA: RlmE family RNA methyltransferase [Treponemataceae bacterium]|nr:50S rRNA methyltransferase [Treponema sp.]HOQ93015.1 RlmE family RNA methyltransferase [Treponemataceae bacterium]HPM06563.1 RlmE family RNA methyltransferase [Treponemataceae bacterium]HPY53300.1 RlmE family RNA methyltransferase [Treponemataceae bacterium]HQC26346.1 RlmE family RNA methyltransferase [Treponemataceae bacterium]